MKKIDEAWTDYYEAEVKAAIAYEEYWLERCKQENIIFGAPQQPNRWPYTSKEAQVGPHHVKFETNVKKYAGAKFWVLTYINGSPHNTMGWRECRVKSERGWEKFLRRLSAPVFV